MKDLEKLAQECMAELDAINIQYRQVIRWVVNTRAKRRWGLCKSRGNGMFEISISSRLLQDDLDDNVAKDTIIHELLHTVKGCVGHQYQWQMLAAKVNARYPQYTIKRTTSFAEKGIKETDYKPRQYTVQYRFKCLGCGRIYERKKASKLVQHPEKYRCGRCGSRLKEI